ncbi:MAG: TRAP transporter small permease, partial [Candidimonas sp.]
MSVAADRVSDVTEAAMTTPLPVVGGVLYRLLRRVCTLLRIVSMLATVAAAAVLSYSVFARYWLRIPTDWEDEASVFLLVGAT